jgi:hypothetical protein
MLKFFLWGNAITKVETQIVSKINLLISSPIYIRIKLLHLILFVLIFYIGRDLHWDRDKNLVVRESELKLCDTRRISIEHGAASYCEHKQSAEVIKLYALGENRR